MRVAVVSDIHANLAALRAVLADAGSVDATWCLGDLVGYGPQPNECIEEIRRRAPHLVCIAGNHDCAALGKLDTKEFNHDAEEAVLWTREQISPISRDYLLSLSETAEPEGFLLAHGSPRDPTREYVVSLTAARDNLALLKPAAPYCLIGHSHLPLIFVESETAGGLPHIEHPAAGVAFPLGIIKLLINPGSVGQPRDGNPAASYLILDTDARTVTYKRVPYPFKETQKLMAATKGRLSERLINRLRYGV
jgi:predicted phosphodiesterase